MTRSRGVVPVRATAPVSLPIALLDLPPQLAPLTPGMIWHERVHGDPAHVWVRQQLVDVAAKGP
jgi:DNA-binding transcriptional LysR family regulator